MKISVPLALAAALCVGPALADARQDLNAAVAAAGAGDNVGARKLLDGVIRSGELENADLAVAYYDRCRVGLAHRQTDLATADCDQAIALNPKFADAINTRAGIDFARGQTDSGIARLTALLRFDPANTVAHTNLANAYNTRALSKLQAGDTQSAVADFGEAIRLSPGLTAAYANRANAYTAIGKYDLAVADFNVVIAARPNDANAHVGRGTAYARLGRQDLAKADFDTAKALGPHEAASAYRQKADADMASRDYRQAVADYTIALQGNAGDALALLNRGAAHQNLGQFDQAIADYTAAIAITPGDARLYNNRGTAYGAERKLDAAIVDFRKALSLQPDFAEASRNLDGALLAKKSGRTIRGR